MGPRCGWHPRQGIGAGPDGRESALHLSPAGFRNLQRVRSGAAGVALTAPINPNSSATFDLTVNAAEWPQSTPAVRAGRRATTATREARLLLRHGGGVSKRQNRPRWSFTDDFKAGAIRLVLVEGNSGLPAGTGLAPFEQRPELTQESS